MALIVAICERRPRPFTQGSEEEVVCVHERHNSEIFIQKCPSFSSHMCHIIYELTHKTYDFRLSYFPHFIVEKVVSKGSGFSTKELSLVAVLNWLMENASMYYMY